MALSQAFGSNQQYNSLHEEEEANNISSARTKKTLILSVSIVLALSIVSSIISLKIVFPSEPTERPFCRASTKLDEALPANPTVQLELHRTHSSAFHMTEEEAADFYWLVVFLPSAIVFCASLLYLISGIMVVYTAPRRHFLLRVADNKFCAPRRGGVECLSFINTIFAIIFGIMALFLGSTLLTLESSCSVPLFVCYEISSLSLVFLYVFTAFLLKRKEVLLIDKGNNYSGDLEMSEEINGDDEITPEMERIVNEGFKQWMGSSLLSSDDEDENPDDYLEVRTGD